MTVREYLFSFQGRINRAKLWLYFLVAFGVELVGVALQMLLVGPLPDDDAVHWRDPAALLFATLCTALGIFLAWSNLAVIVKRLHDRNKSGWWFIVFYVLPFLPLLVLAVVLQASGIDLNDPIPSDLMFGGFAFAAVFQIWAYVELYILPGTYGDNRFGPDPLAKRSPSD